VRKAPTERVMDSNDLEKERGITILAKNTAINWGGLSHQYCGHPRTRRLCAVKSSACSRCGFGLVVGGCGGRSDAANTLRDAEGVLAWPASDCGDHKIDRDEARPSWVLDQNFRFVR